MQDTLLMVFTGVLAVAVLTQSFLFLGIYRSVRRMADRMDGLGKDLLKNAEVVSAKVEEALKSIKGVADSLKPISDNVTNTTRVVHNRVAELDAFLAEATRTAQLEILRIQDTIQTAVSRAQETIELLHTSILAPINEINAISRGLRAGLDILFRRRKRPSGTSAQDEEMFI
jgi:methyl-accepting chemotaxis protein